MNRSTYFRPRGAMEWAAFIFWTNPFFVVLGLLFVFFHVLVWMNQGFWISKWCALWLTCWVLRVWLEWKNARPREEA